MGAWGLGLWDDDMSLDVRDDYLHQLRKKKTPDEAVELLIKTYDPNHSDDGYLFWIVIALTQRHYGHLDETIRWRALGALVEAEQDKRWLKLSAKEREKRTRILKKVAQTLSSPQPKAKKVAPYRGSKSRFKIGEIYSLRFADFQAPNLKNRYLRYTPYSFKFGAFCVVSIEQEENLKEEVVDEYPVVVLFDWIGEHFPVEEDLRDTPILEYDDQRGHWNSFLGAAPERFDYERNQFKLVGRTDRFQRNHFVPIHPKHYAVWSSVQLRIADGREQREAKETVNSFD